MKSSIALACLAFAGPVLAQSTPGLVPPATTRPAAPAAAPAADVGAGNARDTTPRAPARSRGERDSVEMQARAIASVQSLLDGKRYDEALRVAERALRDFPDNAQLRFQRAVTLADTDQAGEAITAFSELTRDYPELAEPYNNLAVLHAASGNLRAARDALEAAVQAVPDYSLAHENLGDLYLRLAVQSYSSATDQASTSAAARRKLVLARGVLEQVVPSAGR